MQRGCRRRLLAALTLAATATMAFDQPDTVAAYPTVFYDGVGSAPHIGLIGDSTLNAVQLAGAYRPLKRYNFTFDAEPCRRTTRTSCGTPPPQNALRTLRRLHGRWGRILVMMTGYNDPGLSFSRSVDAIMAEARTQRIKAVVWLTMRRAPVAYPRRSFRSTSLGFIDNNRILLQKVRPNRGRLQIADWARHSAGRSRWVTDGIHLTARGARAVSRFIADQVGVVLSGRSVTPPRPWSTLRIGSRGRKVRAAQHAIIDAGIPLEDGADGVYGPYTRAAVRVYQERAGIRVTGRVNRPTALVMDIYRLPPPPPS